MPRVPYKPDARISWLLGDIGVNLNFPPNSGGPFNLPPIRCTKLCPTPIIVTTGQTFTRLDRQL